MRWDHERYLAIFTGESCGQLWRTCQRLNLPLAVVEAKDNSQSVGAEMQQGLALRVGEQLHEAENATWQWWKEVHRLTTAC